MGGRMKQKRIALALFVIIKPCCFITWILFNVLGISLGWATGWLNHGMQYEKYVLWIPLTYMLYLQFKFWREVWGCLKNKRKPRWGVLAEEFAVVMLSTSLSMYLFFHPAVMMWNMNH